MFQYAKKFAIVSVTGWILVSGLTGCMKREEEPPLRGEPWALEMLGGEPVLQDVIITLAFNEGQVSGSSGCNTFGGTYAREGSEVRINDIVTTLMACGAPAGVMEQEAAFLESLSTANTISFDAGRLKLAGDDATHTMEFRAR